MAPLFLTIEDVVQAHADQIKRYGGRLGVRDQGGLQSALEMPKAMFAGKYLHEDVFDMASAYLFHLARNHPFIDGNKRIALNAALSFLFLNEIETNANPDELAEFVISVAKGEKTKDEIAQYLRGRCAHNG